jgi:hypothetical protein
MFGVPMAAIEVENVHFLPKSMRARRSGARGYRAFDVGQVAFVGRK